MLASDSSKNFKSIQKVKCTRNYSEEERRKRAERLFEVRKKHKAKPDEEKKLYKFTIATNRRIYDEFKNVCYSNENKPTTYLNEIIEYVANTGELIPIPEEQKKDTTEE